MSSWECTEGPGGYYPGEDGYDEACVHHTVQMLAYSDSNERRVEEHVRMVTHGDAPQLASWIRTDRPVSSSHSSHYGVYLAAKLLHCTMAHVLKIDKYTRLVDRPGRLVLNTFDACVDVPKAADRILLIEVEQGEDEATGSIVRSIQAGVGHLVIFSSSLPPAAALSQYRVLDLKSRATESHDSHV